MLDALVQLSVIRNDAAAPPDEPQEGDRYIVGAGASGPWVGKDQQVAAFQDGAWAFFQPLEGWHAWSELASAYSARAYGRQLQSTPIRLMPLGSRPLPTLPIVWR